MNLGSMSKLISLALRHDPSVIGINLDKNGWADVSDLINGINKNNPNFNMNMQVLEDIVSTNNKKRFEFNDEKTKIRARRAFN